MAFDPSIGDPFAIVANVATIVELVNKTLSRVDELAPFLSDFGCGQSSFIRKAHDLEIQSSRPPHNRSAELVASARTKWKKTSEYLPIIKAFAAELHSLQTTLLSIKSTLDRQHGEKEMENTRLEEQLRMVVCYCDEFCERADHFMGYRRDFCAISWMNVFVVKPLSKSARTEKLSSFDLEPSEAIKSILMQRLGLDVPEVVAIEEPDNKIHSSGQDLMQQALSIRDLGRAALPDSDLPYMTLEVFDNLCLLFGTLICPSLTWLSLRSLELEPASALDQLILNGLPLTATLITNLGHHRDIALVAVASSITTSTGATALPVWKSCMRGRSSAFVSCWLFVAVGSLLWSYMGGSIAGLFLVFMPFALGVGVTSGLLWHRTVSNAQAMRKNYHKMIMSAMRNLQQI